MKKLILFFTGMKVIGAFAFTGQMMFFTVASMFFGRESISIGYIWQMIVLAMIYACLHIHAFSEHESKKLSKNSQLAVLGVPMLLVISAFAYFFQWFPSSNPVNWLIFVGIYTAVFLIAIFAFRIAFRVTGLKYNDLLAAYKANNQS